MFDSVRDLLKEMMRVKADACLILENHKTGEKRIIWGRNIVTNAGDIWYAQRAAGETPTNDFNSLYLASNGPDPVGKSDNYDSFTVISGSEKLVSSGYPKTNDDDPDNTGSGADVVTWLFEYATSDGPFNNVTHSFISVAGAGSGSDILNSYKWSESWSKDSSTSAKIFANHTMNGV